MLFSHHTEAAAVSSLQDFQLKTARISMETSPPPPASIAPSPYQSSSMGVDQAGAYILLYFFGLLVSLSRSPAEC
jgi:hypothetical protein